MQFKFQIWDHGITNAINTHCCCWAWPVTALTQPNQQQLQEKPLCMQTCSLLNMEPLGEHVNTCVALCSSRRRRISAVRASMSSRWSPNICSSCCLVSTSFRSWISLYKTQKRKTPTSRITYWKLCFYKDSKDNYREAWTMAMMRFNLTFIRRLYLTNKNEPFCVTHFINGILN